jgi:hypothetical protein
MEDAPDMPENENFCIIIEHGKRFMGMPGWGKNFSDESDLEIDLISLASRQASASERGARMSKEKRAGWGEPALSWGVAH